MATSDPTISLLPQPSQPTPIEPMRGGSIAGTTDPSVSLLPQPSVAAPVEPMRGGGDQVGNPNISLLPQPSSPVPLEPMKGGAGEKITQGEFHYYSKNFFDEPLLEEETKPIMLNNGNVAAYLARREPLWKSSSELTYRPPSLDPQPKDNDQEGFLNYFINPEDWITLFFVDSYTQFVNIRKFIKLDFNEKIKNRTFPKRLIYILFCNTDNTAIYSDIFRGIVNAVHDIPPQFGDIFLIANRSKMHLFKGTRFEASALKTLNRESNKISIKGSIAKYRLSYEPTIITMPVKTNQPYTLKLAFSAEKIDFINVYKYFGLEKKETINIFGVDYLPKHEETTLYFSRVNSTKYLSELKPGEQYEIKHFEYDKSQGTFINMYRKAYITFSITSNVIDTPLRKMVKSTKENKVKDEDKMDIENILPSKKKYKENITRNIGKSFTGKRKATTEVGKVSEENSAEIALKAQKAAEAQALEMEKTKLLEKDMETFRKKIRNAIGDKKSDNKLIPINLNGTIYEIRPYSTAAWEDWGNLDFIEGEENLIRDIGIYELLLDETSTNDFYHTNIQSFFKDLGTYACFREDHLLLKYECNNVKEFLQKHYELLLNRHLTSIGKYSFEDLNAFSVKNIYNGSLPPPPGSGPSKGGPGAPSAGPSMGPGAGALVPSGPNIWSAPFTPAALAELYSKMTGFRSGSTSMNFDFLFPTSSMGAPTPVPSGSSTSPLLSGATSFSSQPSLLLFANQLGSLQPVQPRALQSAIPPFII